MRKLKNILLILLGGIIGGVTMGFIGYAIFHDSGARVPVIEQRDKVAESWEQFYTSTHECYVKPFEVIYDNDRYDLIPLVIWRFDVDSIGKPMMNDKTAIEFYISNVVTQSGTSMVLATEKRKVIEYQSVIEFMTMQKVAKEIADKDLKLELLSLKIVKKNPILTQTSE